MTTTNSSTTPEEPVETVDMREIITRTSYEHNGKKWVKTHRTIEERNYEVIKPEKAQPHIHLTPPAGPMVPHRFPGVQPFPVTWSSGSAGEVK